MTRYAYVAVEPGGKTKRGTTRADTREDAELALAGHELRNIRVTEKPGLLKLELTARRVKRKEVMHLTRQQAAELGTRGIRVNAVAPGPVDTAMAKQVHTPAIRAGYHDALPLNRYGSERGVPPTTRWGRARSVGGAT